jgi:hypothetical protein
MSSNQTKPVTCPDGWGVNPLDLLEVGDGCSHVIWTDRRAGTIIEKTDTYIVMQYDLSTIKEGYDYIDPMYEYSRDTKQPTHKFTRRVWTDRYGSCRVTYKSLGSSLNEIGNYLVSGRSTYYDPSF